MSNNIETFDNSVQQAQDTSPLVSEALSLAYMPSSQREKDSASIQENDKLRDFSVKDADQTESSQHLGGGGADSITLNNKNNAVNAEQIGTTLDSRQPDQRMKLGNQANGKELQRLVPDGKNTNPDALSNAESAVHSKLEPKPARAGEESPKPVYGKPGDEGIHREAPERRTAPEKQGANSDNVRQLRDQLATQLSPDVMNKIDKLISGALGGAESAPQKPPLRQLDESDDSSPINAEKPEGNASGEDAEFHKEAEYQSEANEEAGSPEVSSVEEMESSEEETEFSIPSIESLMESLQERTAGMREYFERFSASGPEVATPDALSSGVEEIDTGSNSGNETEEAAAATAETIAETVSDAEENQNEMEAELSSEQDDADATQQEESDEVDGMIDNSRQMAEQAMRQLQSDKFTSLSGAIKPEAFQDFEQIAPLLNALSKASMFGGMDAERQVLESINNKLEGSGSDYRVEFGQNIIKTPGGRRLTLQSADGKPVTGDDGEPLVIDFVVSRPK